MHIFIVCYGIINVIWRHQTLNALNSIFRQWRISAPADLWNTTGEPCSGVAIDDTSFESNSNYNPGIKCDCSYNNGTICHITQLRVYALSVRGTIPEELTNLTFLTALNLAQNYLTGPLPAFIGNLSRMQYLSFAINALSGTIPEELGRLQDLRSLAFSSNRFSGTLPSQLGSLVNLQSIYMDSSGVGGEIPATFENLVNMQILWASDNPFSGTIPVFIGNWTQLTSLRFQGNSLEGPIPSIFSRLTSLTDLRISDLSNVSSSLTFVRDMKNLTVLVLRNNLLSGNVPSSVADIQLQRLDLSFNNLTGQIPDSIFNMSSLSYLFLGNNSLSGSIPPRKVSSLLTVNVVANNLTFGASDCSFLDSGLNCLQASFPCSRGSPRYSSFAINCGGPERSSTDGTIFEAENSIANPASYNVTDERKWGVSNIGLFGDNSGPAYVVNTVAQATGALDTELFQTARLSPGSLRYFGLGLENGQYNVNLQFAETGFTDEALRTWESLGRRIFDIYLQGTLRVKDFNIRREAGGAINRAVLRDFTVQVSENFLEIHLFWAGKGTCCIPRQGYYGPIISAIKVTPEFEPTVDNLPLTRSSKNNTGTIVGITVPIVLVIIICVFAVIYLRRKNSSMDGEDGSSAMDLDWNTRYNICLGTARGLAYLHEESTPRIVHRDVKASNILLDLDLNPKISDFGLAKLYDDKKTHISTRVAGTIGYLAPEYAMRGHLTEKADVFGFGVVALEILCGRPNTDTTLEPEKIYLLEWAWTLYESNRGSELVDSRLTKFNQEEAIRMLGVALLCTQASPVGETRGLLGSLRNRDHTLTSSLCKIPLF
ncbi:hypothetical protein ACHQM5_004130 [Ranunculus cassubicifolius]